MEVIVTKYTVRFRPSKLLNHCSCHPGPLKLILMGRCNSMDVFRKRLADYMRDIGDIRPATIGDHLIIAVIDLSGENSAITIAKQCLKQPGG